MYQKERVDEILKILHENNYVNVKYLCDKIGYSKATINRDLNYMEEQNLIVRSYGGVELVENDQFIPLRFRYHKMKNEKKRICKAAAELVKDGDTIFIDSSSTTEYMAPYLINKKDLTVITSNIAIVTYLSDHPHIRTICMGGEILESPYFLGGDLCVKNIMEYKTDKLFFASIGICDNGEIVGMGMYSLPVKAMMQNSAKSIYIADHEKFNTLAKTVITRVDEVDIIVTDYKFSDEFKAKYKHTEFIEV